MNSLKSMSNGSSGRWCRNAVQLLTVTLGVLLLCTPAFSQGSFGRILGTVTDSSGGVVAGATVTVLDTERGVTRTLTTDDAGEYNAPTLSPSTYLVRAEAKGFKKLERQSILLQVGQEIRIDLSLQPGGQEQTVTVTESVPLVETTNATLGGTLDNADIIDMPLNGRNYQMLLGLRPGVMVQPGGGPWTQSTNGIRADESVWMVDGVINANFFDARPILGMSSPTTDMATILPIDAIQEFNTQENPKAEYGWKPGSVVDVGIKSGTNQFHGSAYGFYRSAAWDARNYFNIAPTGSTCPLGALVLCDKTPAQLKQFGADVGGPIIKDKLFFFGNYEGLRDLIGNAFTSSSPETDATGSATLSMVQAINGLNRAGITPSAVSLALACPNAVGQSLPLPSTFACTPPAYSWPVNTSGSKGFLSTFPNANQSDNGIGKIDYHLNDKNTITGFVAIGRYLGTGEDHPFVSAAFENTFPIKTLTDTENWIWTPSSSVVNELRFGYNRMSIQQLTNDTAVKDPIDTGLTTPGLPNIAVSGFGSWGSQHNRPQSSSPNPYYDIQDSVSYLKGKHGFKFGVEFAHIEADSDVPDLGRGKFSFNGDVAIPGVSTPLEDFFAGAPTTGQAIIGNATRVEKWTSTSAFVQDDWHLTPKLILNLGLRYTYQSPLKEASNNWANFDPSSPTGMTQQGASGTSTLWTPDHKDFSPRLGFAYDVTGKGTTVVRGGFSVMYSTFSAVIFTSQPSFQNSSSVFLGAVPTGAYLQTGGCLIAGTVTCPGGGGNIQLGAGTFGPSSVCWDPSSSLTGTGCSASQTTAFPSGHLACGDGLTVGGVKDASPCNLMGVDPNLRTPYVVNFNFGIQHSFGNNLSLEVGYVGNLGKRLIGINDINQPAVGAGYCLNATLTAAQLANACASVPTGGLGLGIGNASLLAANEGRPYYSQFPWIGFVNEVTNDVHSNYNSLQATLTKRLSHGLSFIAGYTYAHGLDTGSLNRFTLIPQDGVTGAAGQYASSDFDVRNRFTFTTTYNIPGIKGYGQLLEGWQVNAIVNLQSAQPWLANDYTDNFSGAFDNADQWNFTGNPASMQGTANGLPYCSSASNCSITSTVTGLGTSLSNSSFLWGKCQTAAGSNVAAIATLNKAGCYASPSGDAILTPNALGAFGNMGRNIFRDSGFKDMDFSLFKNFTFKERFGAQFRVEIFNLFNHPIPANPYGASGNFGGNGANNDLSNSGAFGGSPGTPDTIAGNPLIGSGSARDIQLGLKLTF